jgi:hypothetical protein
MQLRTDRVGVLVDQLDTSVEMARERFVGLTDDEYLWEPAPAALSIRRPEDVRVSGALGHGDWLLEWPRPEPDPPPLRTIAWLVGHLYDQFNGRYEWTFGSRQGDVRTMSTFLPSADQALTRLWAVVGQWRDGLDSLSDHQLDMIGYGQFPAGLDPQIPIIAIAWWVNRELIHHTAEIALLRDLYASSERA